MCIVSKGIVELRGGSISVTSEGIGKGSCFSVEIPISSNVFFLVEGKGSVNSGSVCES